MILRPYQQDICNEVRLFEVAMLAGEFREYGQALVDWSARYVCI